MSAQRSDTAGLPPAPAVVQIEVGLLQNFCEILYCPDTREAAIVDPAWEVDRLLREVERLKLRVTTLLITHTHNDHIEGVAELVQKTGAAVVVHPREAERVRAAGRTLVEVADGRDLIRVAPWVSVAPGIALGIAVLGFNLLGDGLRQALDATGQSS